MHNFYFHCSLFPPRIFVFIWKSFPAAWIKPFNIFLCHVTDRYSQFLFTKKFINLTFILSEFFHSIEDLVTFWSVTSITFKTTIFLARNHPPVITVALKIIFLLLLLLIQLHFVIFLHLLKYYIPYRLFNNPY